MGENLFGAGGGCRNMLYIALDYGIGSGMILDGRLFEGARGFSGEIGLWLMDPCLLYTSMWFPRRKRDSSTGRRRSA